MNEQDTTLDTALAQHYPAGFETQIETRTHPPGLTEATVRAISAEHQEPEWLLQWRLDAFAHWQTMRVPTWAKLRMPDIDLQALSYFSTPKKRPKSLDEVDPELLRAYEKLGVPLHERATLAGVAVDVVLDSVSLGTTVNKLLDKSGVLFCSFSEAVKKYPELVRQHLGSVVGPADNYYAALNAAAFSDGSFVYIPEGVRCPIELSTYFRMNARGTGQFERTLIIAEKGSYVSYLEGCSAPSRPDYPLHAAVVELIAQEKSEIRYATVQNWYPGDADGVGGVLNLVTKRGLCAGEGSTIRWTQVETGSAITWKYPSCILLGNNSVGEFNSVALTRYGQQADTGTKMIHLGRNTKSTIVSRGISAGKSSNTYRGQVRVDKGAEGARSHTRCDSLLIGKRCGAHTFPSIEVKDPTATVEHEATTSRIGEDQLFYLRTRGLDEEQALALIVEGFCKPVFNELPMEFAVEARALLALNLEGAIG